MIAGMIDSVASTSAQDQQPAIGHLDRASEVLGDAFRDYPLFTASLKDPLRRHAALPMLWRCLSRQFTAHDLGELDLVQRDGQDAGAALWGDGMKCEVGWLEVLRTGQVRFGVTAGVRDSLRLMKAEESVTGLHREVISAPHVYLVGIGVRPRFQGQGVGSELLRKGLERADALRLPVYLETNEARNAEIYQHVGFETVALKKLDGLDTWAMLRPAR